MSASLAIGRERRSILPGFGIALGFTLTYLGLIVLLPLAGLVIKSAGLGPAEFWDIATDERTGRESVLIADTSVAGDERKTRAVFDAIGTGHGTRAQVALRFVLSNPNISCAVIGSAELHHIDEALHAAEMGPLPPDVLSRLDALYESDFGRA